MKNPVDLLDKVQRCEKYAGGPVLWPSREEVSGFGYGGPGHPSMASHEIRGFSVTPEGDAHKKKTFRHSANSPYNRH